MRRLWMAFLTALVVLTACGTLEVGMERAPAPDSRTATIDALATQNARLAAQVATLVAPTLSPDLGWLAYVQGGDIWVKALPSGEPRRLTTDGRNREPRWSPSGEWLAFRKGEQVWMIRADGSDPTPVAGGTFVSVFAWAPDRDRLAYVGGNELYVANTDGSSPTNRRLKTGATWPSVFFQICSNACAAVG